MGVQQKNYKHKKPLKIIVKKSFTTETWQVATSFIKGLIINGDSPHSIHQTLYGNNPVCIFKYFVKTIDPQYEFSLMMTILNCCCIITITICYSYIIYLYNI